MDLTNIIQLLTGTPMSLVLLYLLISEQRAHVETRKARDEQIERWQERFAALADRVAGAVERLDLPGPRA